MPFGKPNIVLPLASSYDERGVAGYTATATNSLDQRKINCFYEVSRNALTGAGKIRLTKRPGVSSDGNTYGISTQSAYLAAGSPNASITFQTGSTWVFSGDTSGTNSVLRISDPSTSFVLTAGAGTSVCFPMFVGKTLISGVENVVLQTRFSNYPTTGQRAFYSSSSVNSWAEITHTNFTSLIQRGKMENMDGFAFILDNQNRIFTSSSNSLANWGPADFITKQIQQDFPVGLARLNNQILAFGEQSVEAFYNAGNTAGSPLSGIKQLQQKIGMIYSSGGTHYYTVHNDLLYFVGRRVGGLFSAGVFSYDGSRYEKISTSYIDKILSEFGSASVNLVGFQHREAIAIALTIGSGGIFPATQRWLMFFPDWKEWFEWTSDVFLSINNSGIFIGNGASSNKAFFFGNSSGWQDAGTSYTMQTQFKLPNDGSPNKFMTKYGVQGDTSTTAQGLLVEFSDDDYQTWQSAATLDLTQQEKTATRGGRYYDRAVRLTSTTAAEVRLSAFEAWVQ